LRTEVISHPEHGAKRNITTIRKFTKLLLEESNNGCLTINLSGRYVTDFKNTVLEISNGEGDFAIADDQDQNILYFWWYLE